MLCGSNNTYRPDPAVCGLWSTLTPCLGCCDLPKVCGEVTVLVLGLTDLGLSHLHHFQLCELGQHSIPGRGSPPHRASMMLEEMPVVSAELCAQRTARASPAVGLFSSSRGWLVEWGLISRLPCHT